MIYITEVRMGKSGAGAEHIEAVRWESQNTPETGESTLEEMIDWIGGKKGFAQVRNANGEHAEVHVINREGRKHLRTVANGKETTDLLFLPRFGVRPQK
jgi:hypothetical protein